MHTLLEKRAQYVNKILNAKNEIDAQVKEFDTQLTAEKNAKVEALRQELETKYTQEIDTYKRRIDVLDEMIKEEMPEAETITTLINTNVVEDKVDVIEVDKTVPETKHAKDAIIATEIKPEVVDVDDAQVQVQERPGLMEINVPSRL